MIPYFIKIAIMLCSYHALFDVAKSLILKRSKSVAKVQLPF